MVVQLVAEDKKNHDVALELGLKDHTVRNYIFRYSRNLVFRLA